MNNSYIFIRKKMMMIFVRCPEISPKSIPYSLTFLSSTVVPFVHIETLL